MTCIAAVVDRAAGVIHMMGDSLRTTEIVCKSDAQKKIWRCKKYEKTWLIGEAGNNLHLQICQHLLEWPEEGPDQDLIRFFSVRWIPALRRALREHGSLRNDSGLEEVDATLLIGVDERLFVIDGILSVFEFEESYGAIGRGQKVAFGSLGTSEGTALTPRERLKKALELSAKYCPGVGGRFDYLHT